MSTPMPPAPLRFADLHLPEPLLRALADVGYESPSPIQSATLPPLLAGRDLIGQAQTGTGKTAAFALPILARIASEGVVASARERARGPRALVLAPTRELAIQVAEAFVRYAAHLPGFHVLPIYGGQGYAPQLSSLRRGVDVVVGTPGRVIDHLERGTLDLSALQCLVLDEADEMLRMGFIDDVETVLKKIPEQRQIALFSATMPTQIKRIAQTYLRDPVEIAIKAKTTTAAGIRQRYWLVSGVNKLDALTRILEAEPFAAMLVFARTKQATEELANKLAARGFSAAAIHGDIAQPQRERAIAQLRDGQIDILVATDVAARGLDVERISHVLNYDIPYDTESYVHRIGRTGRAGRTGEAIVFVAPRERGMLRAIERATRQTIEAMTLPSVEAVNDRRVAKFLARIDAALAGDGLAPFRALVERYEREHGVAAIEIAAALAKLVQGKQALFLDAPAQGARAEWKSAIDAGAAAAVAVRGSTGSPRTDFSANAPRMETSERSSRSDFPTTSAHADAAEVPARANADSFPRARGKDGMGASGADSLHGSTGSPRTDFSTGSPRTDFATGSPRTAAPAGSMRTDHSRGATRKPARRRDEPEAGMETFRIEVGHAHGVQPGNIVGAIANEADLESRYIGRIDIRDGYSLVDLPQGMPRELLELLKRVRVAGQMLRMRRWDGSTDSDGAADAGFQAPDRARKHRAAARAPTRPHRKGPPRHRG